jgi:hypothetical protein
MTDGERVTLWFFSMIAVVLAVLSIFAVISAHHARNRRDTARGWTEVRAEAIGPDSATLFFTLQDNDPTRCGKYLEAITTDRKLSKELTDIGFDTVACVDLKADLPQ